MNEDCIFCKIVSGEIPSEKIYESDNFFVIKDIHPRTKGHSLIIPKKHYPTFLDIPVFLFQEFLDTTKKVTMKLIDEEKAEGFNLIMNNYKAAGQLVPHAHLHVLPRKKDDGFKLNV